MNRAGIAVVLACASCGQGGLWARGIAVPRVEVNQGVSIPIAVDGRATTVEERVAPVIQNRQAWVLVHVEVEDDWEPRDIEATLVLEHADGSLFEESQVRTVDGSTADWAEDCEGGWRPASYVDDLEGFRFGIAAPEVRPGLRFRVELREVERGASDLPRPDEAPDVPVEGFLPVGVEDSYQNIRVVMVPFTYDSGDCQTVGLESAEEMQPYIDALYAMNPLESWEFTLHEPVPHGGSFEGSCDFRLGELSQLKAADGGEPNQYYYGVLAPCGGFNECPCGVAFGTPGGSATQSQSLARVAGGLAGNPQCFVHEIGHLQGRPHAPCGDPGGVDPYFPHEEARLGTWGYGLLDGMLHHPELNADYMSYCGPSWVSDYTWFETWERIATLSSWELERQAVVAEPGLLLGMVRPDRSTWWTAPGRIPSDEPRSSDHSVTFVGSDGAAHTEEALFFPVDHDEGYLVIAPLAEDFSEVHHAGRVVDADDIAEIGP